MWRLRPAIFLFGCGLLAAETQTTPQIPELRAVEATSWECSAHLEGSAKTEDGKERNRQKNRPPADLTNQKILALNTAAFLARAAEYDSKLQLKHRRFFSSAQKEQLQGFEKDVVSLTGWLIMAYHGVPETANCRSKDFLDWHLELSEKPADHPPQIGDPTPIQCEITPRTEAAIYASGVRIQKLAASIRLPDNTVQRTGAKPHRIRVTGYLLWDDEHNGPNDIGSTVQWFTSEGYHHPWRSTAWEVHPVLKIEDLGTE